MSAYLNIALTVITTVMVLVAAAKVLWQTNEASVSTPSRHSRVQTVSGLSISHSEMTHVRGSGRIALVEFSDFECPFCSRHANTTARTIATKWLSPGYIRHVFFNYPLPIHSSARKASEAVECASNQGRYWEMHERLFASFPALQFRDLMAHASRVGVDSTTFAACLDSGETTARVERDIEVGRRLGVSSTPVFFIGTVEEDGGVRLVRRIDGAVPFEHFDTALSEFGAVGRNNR
jgi:protein-disulfide isomerase